jgi:hypothetical protein
MGLRPLDLRQWVEVDEDFDVMWDEQRAVLDSHHHEVIAVAEQGDGVADAQHLFDHQPDRRRHFEQGTFFGIQFLRDFNVVAIRDDIFRIPAGAEPAAHRNTVADVDIFDRRPFFDHDAADFVAEDEGFF